MNSIEITKPVEDIGLLLAELSGASHLPGLSGVVHRYREQRRIDARQSRLRPFAGRIIFIGGNFGYSQRANGNAISAEEIADRTSRKLITDRIVTKGAPLVIRAMISKSGVGDRVEESTQLMRQSAENNKIAAHLITQPEPIEITMGESDAPMEPAHRAIDETILELEQDNDPTLGLTSPYLHPHSVIAFLADDEFASSALPPSISRGDMILGGTALLVEVLDTANSNIWLPEVGGELHGLSQTHI